MDLSIIILNYKTRGLTKQCIKNIKENTAGLNYEIIVVDNGSGDGCEQMISENFPDVKFIQSGKNLGFAAGNNSGIKQAQGKYIMILNPDITVLSNAIEKMVRFMEANPDVGLAGPRLINPNGTFQISCRTFIETRHIILLRTPLGKFSFAKSILDKHLMADFDRLSNRAVDCLHGACLLARKSAVDKIGLFDERYFMYVEDIDWCRRFWDAKYKVYFLGEAEMIHLLEKASDHGSWNFWKLDKTTRWHIASWIKYIFKYLGSSKTCQTQTTI
ncbi:MAG: glycosyltransferase family 2 protein [Candidatus Parcubacteria bacterium]|nr:glycosyltransferase family 2 protein [Candidatus Parcubacteria bacterium]